MRTSARRVGLTTTVIAAASIAFAAGPCMAQSEEAVPAGASIKPVHSLVASVMAGVGTPFLIVQGGGSPHTYSLKPSDAAALKQARVVFWVGETLEVFLAGALETIAENAVVVELSEADGLAPLPLREGGVWESHDDHDDGHERAHDAGHGDHAETDAHHGFDPHIWLDPQNAQAMVAAITAALSSADPEHADAYAANGAATTARLDALTAEIATILDPVRDRPFIVFHDGYHYFEDRFGLNAAGSITVSPDVQPGAARLMEVRDKVAALGAVCVLTEPQFEPRLVQTVIEGTTARTAMLDPLGADLADGPDLYFDMMLGNARALRDCLSEQD